MGVRTTEVSQAASTVPQTRIKQYGPQGPRRCGLCGKTTHSASNCPAPKYNVGGTDGEKKIHGVPEDLLKNIQKKDGLETIAPSQSEYQRLVAEGGLTSALKGIDMSKLPTGLKCAITGKILEDAVRLPCCQRTVSDSVIRAALHSSNLQCPLCKKSNVSPDEVAMCHSVDSVEVF